MSSKKLLTKVEILKMGNRDYMNEVQFAFSKDRLVKMHDEVFANVNQIVSDLRETVVVPDPVDRATIEKEYALELHTRNHGRKLLRKVEQSIARIDAGDYGYCDEVGGSVDVLCLIARPTANLTLEAQKRREKRQKVHDD